jgi:hypothetical protein
MFYWSEILSKLLNKLLNAQNIQIKCFKSSQETIEHKNTQMKCLKSKHLQTPQINLSTFKKLQSHALASKIHSSKNKKQIILTTTKSPSVTFNALKCQLFKFQYANSNAIKYLDTPLAWWTHNLLELIGNMIK